MALFAYVLENVVRPTPAAISAHVRYLGALDDALVCSGALRDGSGAVVCVTAEDEADADAIARADPLVVFGFTLYCLHELERNERGAVATAALSG